MDRDFSHTLSDGRTGFPALLDAIEAELAASEAPDSVIAPVLIALDEVISNALDHGGEAGATPMVRVTLRVGEGRVAVQVVDDGVAFNPIDQPAPDTALPMEARAIGGLGIHLVRKLMDAVDYDRRAGHNHLRFSKAYSSASPS
ncbi:ATP-binding protein [Phenylobacterium sp.]|uniref:ATP-binding protein n=1 Tax=Phenylobacterium sp. TaxID=1871053 RepID=UPI0025D235F2|nr:ATP-binding protein [Phenylobacterium sp.]